MAYRVIYDGVMGRGKIQFATEQQLKEFIENKGGLEELRKLNPEVEIVVPLRLEEVDTVVNGKQEETIMAEIPDYDLVDIINSRLNTAIQATDSYMESDDKAGVKWVIEQHLKLAMDLVEQLKGTP